MTEFEDHWKQEERELDALRLYEEFLHFHDEGDRTTAQAVLDDFEKVSTLISAFGGGLTALNALLLWSYAQLEHVANSGESDLENAFNALQHVQEEAEALLSPQDPVVEMATLNTALGGLLLDAATHLPAEVLTRTQAYTAQYDLTEAMLGEEHPHLQRVRMLARSALGL